MHPVEMPVSFIHIDCDLLESTRQALAKVSLKSGSIIQFDEAYGHPAYEAHEGRPMTELPPYEEIGRGESGAIAVRIV